MFGKSSCEIRKIRETLGNDREIRGRTDLGFARNGGDETWVDLVSEGRPNSLEVKKSHELVQMWEEMVGEIGFGRGRYGGYQE